MRGFGGMLTFDVGSLDAARDVLNRVRLMALAESLGGVETLISHPASMTHASVPPERRAAIGLTDSLVRISAGHRGSGDLIDDLTQALRVTPVGGVTTPPSRSNLRSSAGRLRCRPRSGSRRTPGPR